MACQLVDLLVHTDMSEQLLDRLKFVVDMHWFPEDESRPDFLCRPPTGQFFCLSYDMFTSAISVGTKLYSDIYDS